MMSLTAFISFVLITSCTLSSAQTQPPVLTGLDVSEEDDLKEFWGKNIGLITNHTGIDKNKRHIVDVFAKQKKIKLVALFSPEHGLRGEVDRSVESSIDTATGLPVYSLYKPPRYAPSEEQLKGIDTLVFHIQDIGVRYYTYITTMAICMKTAKERNIAFYVLDLPNPINGIDVEGPLLEDRLAGGFASYYPIPVKHAMTIGELARLFNEHFGIHCDLRVIKMKNWRRDMWHEDTGRPWVNPSPNIRNMRAVVLYPGLGILEATNFSVGRGTDRPFECYGAPWVDATRLVNALNALKLKGVFFKTAYFTPTSSSYRNRRCQGFEVRITDRNTFKPVDTFIYVSETIYKIHGKKFYINKIDRSIGRKDIREKIISGTAPADIVRSWAADTQRFNQIRSKYLLY